MKILLMLLICSTSFAGTDFKAYHKAKKEAEEHRDNCQHATRQMLLKDVNLYTKLGAKDLEDFEESFCEREFPLPPRPPECEE
jgi:hypothetical protein